MAALPSPVAFSAHFSDGRSGHRMIVYSAAATIRAFPASHSSLSIHNRIVVYGSANKLCRKFCGLKLRIVDNLNFQRSNGKYNRLNEFKIPQIVDRDQSLDHLETKSSNEEAAISLHEHHSQESASVPNLEGTARSSAQNFDFDISRKMATSRKPLSSLLQNQSLTTAAHSGRSPFLSIAVIGATGELARGKIFPALFALYYSGYLPEDLLVDLLAACTHGQLPFKCTTLKIKIAGFKLSGSVLSEVICWLNRSENVAIYGYSRKNLTDDELRSITASTLTCRIDHQQNCEDKIDAFLRRMYYLNAGYDNREGMLKLNALMEQIEGEFEANRMFYLSVPEEALLDVALCLADNAQTQKGWNRIIIEKPFGFGSQSCHKLTHSLLSKFEEKQLYRIDHLLGRNTIENLTVLRFSNLVFMPSWNRNYIQNVQVTLSEDLHTHMQSRYLNCYGIIGDVVHSHILQTIALLAMEPPVTLNGEDVRNEKVKVLRSIRRLDPKDVILGQCVNNSGGRYDGDRDDQNPTFFAAALHIDNARWDGVPFLIKAGRGLNKTRVEIRIQFRQVPGNLYHQHIGNDVNLGTNELILRDVPDEATLVRVNNKIPGLAMHLDASELNLLYKDKYNVEVPDSYEQLLHDVIDGDNHLFMRSDEVTAAWNILSPVLHEIDNNNIIPEPYELGGRGPDKAIYLWAKYGVQWLDD